MIELVVSTVILVVVIGAITVSLLTVLTLSGATAKSISDSADAQAVSATLTTDVHGAAEITTAAAPTSTAHKKCGPSTATQLLGLEWGQVSGTTTYDTVVSYLAVKRDLEWVLVRDECTTGFSTRPATSHTVSSDICEPTGSAVENGCVSPQGAPTVEPSTKNTKAETGWTSAAGVTEVKFKITEPGSHYTYTLVAEPASGSAPSGTTTVNAESIKCEYAAPGTGTYAQKLCFVNFETYTYEAAAYPSCQTMTQGITRTPFTLSFCLSVKAGTESEDEAPPSGWTRLCDTPNHQTAGTPKTSGVARAPNPPAKPWCDDPSSADIVAVPFPTYSAPPGSEAYLGDNGFYTGVSGDPALYSYLEGTSVTLYFTDIKIKDQNGNTATSWQLVSGDAESTDTDESITWSTCPAKTTASHTGALQTSCTGTPTPPNLSLIADDPTSTPPNYYGNACLNTKYTNTTTSWLRYGALAPDDKFSTGVGTVLSHTSAGAQEVECASAEDVDKTGTVMLEAPAPTTLTVNMVGSGLQAIFLGFLL